MKRLALRCAMKRTEVCTVRRLARPAMGRAFLLLSPLLLLGLIALSERPARGDLITLPVKWSQPIGVNPANGLIFGADRLSDHTVGVVMADDFISDGRPIVAVRWWGSYIGQTSIRPTAFIGPFDISFHLSVFPPGAEHPFSLPSAEPMYLRTLLSVQEEFVGFDEAGHAVYRYDAFLPDPFFEQAGVEYFLDIDKPTNENWGWHDSRPPHPILDWAAFAPGHFGPWATFQPNTDLAFELMTNVDNAAPEASTLPLIVGASALSLLGRTIIRRRRSARNSAR